MKAYAGNRDDESQGIEYNDVEIICNEYELEMLINSLNKFKKEIENYKKSGQVISGFTHMHFRDNNPKWKNSDADLVVYVDLSDNNPLCKLRRDHHNTDTSVLDTSKGLD